MMKKKKKKKVMRKEGNEKPTLLAYPDDKLLQTTKYRQNLCDRHAESMLDNTDALRHSLKGLQLNALIMEGPFFELDKQGGINVTVPHHADPSAALLIPALLDELANRAEFTWRTSFGTTSAPNSSSALPWTKLLYWGVEHFDIYVHNWARNAVREKKKVDFTKSWYDASIVMVGASYSEQEETIETLKDWLQPFGKFVWLITFLTIVISGGIDQLTEYQSMKKAGQDWLELKKLRLKQLQDHLKSMEWDSKDEIIDNLDSLWEDFSTTYIFETNTPAGRVCGSSMVLLALVIVCWSVLQLGLSFIGLFRGNNGVAVVASGIRVANIQEAIQQRYPMCTVESTNADIFIRKHYPTANRILKQSAEETFLSLQSGECSIAITEADAWKFYQHNGTLNPGGDKFTLVGDVVEPFEAGFAVKADGDELCSSLIKSALDVHLVDMLNEGFVNKAWMNQLKRLLNETELALLAKEKEEAVDEDLSVNEESDATSYVESMTIEVETEQDDRPWRERSLSLLVSPRAWWRGTKYSVKLFWLLIEYFVLFVFVLLLTFLFAYAIMICLLYVEHFLSGNVGRSDRSAASVESRGRSRTPKPVNGAVQNPYQNGKLVI